MEPNWVPTRNSELVTNPICVRVWVGWATLRASAGWGGQWSVCPHRVLSQLLVGLEWVLGFFLSIQLMMHGEPVVGNKTCQINYFRHGALYCFNNAIKN